MEIIEIIANDGAILTGYINKGNTRTDKILITTHGMSSNCLKNREKIIAKSVEKIGIDTISFNNRGNGIVNFVKFKDGGRILAGTAFENIEDCYFDILGAIKYAISIGYKEIYLEGHSLGASKMLYTYNKMKQENNQYLKNIKAILLLSFVDVEAVFKKFSTEELINYANSKLEENKLMELMPYNAFLSPISVKNYLRYLKIKEEINKQSKRKESLEKDHANFIHNYYLLKKEIKFRAIKKSFETKLEDQIAQQRKKKKPFNRLLYCLLCLHMFAK